MKNKLILLLVALLALVFTFAACSGSAATTTEAPDTTTAPVTTTEAPVTTTPLDGDDAMAAFEYVSEKMNALLGFEVEMTEETSYNGVSDKMDMKVKVAFDEGKKAFMSVKMDEGTMDATYIDGVVYVVMKMTGMEMKYKTQDASMTASFEKIFNTFEDEHDDKADIASISFVSRENGVYKLTAVMTEEAALELVLAGYEGYEIDASAFSNVSQEITFECTADGYVTKQTQTLTYTVAGAVCTETTSGNYLNLGVIPEINAPADADSYMNMDEME